MAAACILLFSTGEMNTFLLAPGRFEARPPNEQLAESLRQALAQQYGQMFASAQQNWERYFAGQDPSDACVSVRVSSGQALHAA